MVDVNPKKGVLPRRGCCFRRWRGMQRYEEDGRKRKALRKKESKGTMKAVRQTGKLCNSSMADPT